MKNLNPPPQRHIISAQVQEELYEIGHKIRKKYRLESLSKLLRCLLIEKARELGIDASGIENPSWGVRRDLASGDEIALEQTRRYLEKARAAKAAKRAAKLDAIRKEKQSELES